LVVRPPICLFCIAHFTFTSSLCFCFNLIQPSAFSLLTCECARIRHAFISLPIWRSTNSHTWRHPRCHVCPCLREWARCMEIALVRPYVKNFIMSQVLHDSRRPSFCCRCDGYWFDVGDGGFKCH
jgi:hypothetical protein